MIELTEVMRQRDDRAFSELLCRVRTNSCTSEDLVETLKSREIAPDIANYPTQALYVYRLNIGYHRYRYIISVSVPIFKLAHNTWRAAGSTPICLHKYKIELLTLSTCFNLACVQGQQVQYSAVTWRDLYLLAAVTVSLLALSSLPLNMLIKE